MFLLRRLHLRDDEHVIRIVRRSPVAYARTISLALLAPLAGALSLAPLLAWERWGILVLTALAVVAVGAGIRAWWRWYGNAFVITDQRVIDVDQRGFFHRAIAEARYGKIEDVSIEIRGVLATLLGVGTIRIQTTGGHAMLELRSVARPEDVQDVIDRMREHGATVERTNGAL